MAARNLIEPTFLCRQAPGISHSLNFRPGTTDIDVIRYVFKEQAFSLIRLRR
jgi:hypothetical protein